MQSLCSWWVIFFLREFCSFNTHSIVFSHELNLNWCHKSVWSINQLINQYWWFSLLQLIEKVKVDWNQLKNFALLRLIVESSFHTYFLTRSSTRYQCRDSIQILDTNLVTRLDIDLESSQNSSSRFDSSSNWKFRVQWEEILITTSRSFSSRISIFRIHENTDYY